MPAAAIKPESLSNLRTGRPMAEEIKFLSEFAFMVHSRAYLLTDEGGDPDLEKRTMTSGLFVGPPTRHARSEHRAS
jgi:hypothetical protein